VGSPTIPPTRIILGHLDPILDPLEHNIEIFTDSKFNLLLLDLHLFHTEFTKGKHGDFLLNYLHVDLLWNFRK